MNQIANIAQAIETLWTANATLPENVPGGLKFGGIITAKTPRPFASLVVEMEGEPEYSTGLVYCQDYRAVITVWAPQELATSAQIQADLETLMSATTKFSLPNSAQVLYIQLEPQGLEEEMERFKGQFTFAAGAAWTIQLQEFRT